MGARGDSESVASNSSSFVSFPNFSGAETAPELRVRMRQHWRLYDSLGEAIERASELSLAPNCSTLLDPDEKAWRSLAKLSRRPRML